MASNEHKAYQLVLEARKKLSSVRRFFASLFGSAGMSPTECYQRAANLYKMDKNWNSAAQAYLSAANLYEQDNCCHEAASNYVEAAKCLRRYDIDLAVGTLIQAIDCYTEMGRFATAAKHHETVAEMYESKGNSFLHSAVQHYERAAEYYRCEESHSAVNKCLLKVAQFASQAGNYEKAIRIYEEAAESALKSSLLRFSAKEYLCRAALCHLVVDALDAHHALMTYVEIHPVFEDSREYTFLLALIGHIDEQNVQGFTDAVTDYDRISSLDHWYTTMLLRIKRKLCEVPDLR